MFSPALRRRLVLRSLLVQASWNYRTLIGTGFAFLLLPALRRLNAGDPEALQGALHRHARLFNSHPYLVPLAAGAVLRMEAEGASEQSIDRFKAALRGSLGSLGDRLFWTGARPAAALLGVALLLLGLPWWVAVAAFLIPYNALHLWIRVWGLNTGLREGAGIAAALRASPLQQLASRTANSGALLAGFCTVLAAGSGAAERFAAPTLAGAIVAGLFLGGRVRPLSALVLFLGWLHTVGLLFLS
ncbi:MAG: PTS system mannose/fructose/sorbose family transporter subunit IID [Gemmatimonadota bacterium]|nr:PTS system mannose/fructose/sorbose family transporter subunit IID [Gemmatimonadota bacterium]